MINKIDGDIIASCCSRRPQGGKGVFQFIPSPGIQERIRLPDAVKTGSLTEEDEPPNRLICDIIAHHESSLKVAYPSSSSKTKSTFLRGH